MKNLIASIVIIFLNCSMIVAQNKIVLNSPKQQFVETYLYEEDNNYLLTLPLTFSITNKNILIMMVGNDTKLTGGQSVWMFSDEIYLDGLLKTDRNVTVTKSFKNRNPEFNTVLLPNRKITIHREFDDGYEIVKKNAKPVFFNINNSTSDPLTFYLQFYVAKSDSKYPYIIIAKCRPIEIELIIK